MISLLLSLFPGRTHIPTTPWAPGLEDPHIVLCMGELQPYPTNRVLEALYRWQEWGADFSSIVAKPCDYELGPLIGEAWLDITDTMPCDLMTGACLLGMTGRYIDDNGDTVATVTEILASPQVYDMGVIEHEVGHVLGLLHVCEVNSGFGTLREGFHYCKDGEAAGHLLHPSDVATQPYLVDGVREALRKR